MLRSGLAVRIVVEPAAFDETQEMGLPVEAQPGIEVLGVVGLQSDVLAGHRLLQTTNHRGSDAAPAHGRVRPHIKEVGVANAVGQHSGHTHQSGVPPDERHVR